MKKVFPSLFVLIFLISANIAFAQSVTVSGTVFDENEAPILLPFKTVFISTKMFLNGILKKNILMKYWREMTLEGSIN